MTGEGKDKEARTKPEIEVAFVDASPAGEPEMSPVPGMDLQTFRNYVTRALSGDESVPGSVLELVGGVRRGVGAAGAQPDGEGEWFHDFVWRQAIEESLKAINGLIDRYNEMADWDYAQSVKARERMGEAVDKLDEIDEFTSGADDVLKGYKDTGKIDRAKAIALLKQRGVTVDANEDDKSLLARLQKERELALSEKARWNKQYDDANADANFYDAQEKENRRKAEELARQRDAVIQSGASPEEQAQKLRALEDKASIDVTLKAAAMEPPAKSGQSAAQDEATKEAWSHSQDAQAGSEVSDFEALAGSLTSKFAASAAKDQEPATVIPTAESAAARPAAPGSSLG